MRRQSPTSPETTVPAAPPRILLTPGEPAGIGPDLVCAIAQQDWAAELVAVADPGLLSRRARALNLALQLEPFHADTPAQTHRAGYLKVWPVDLAAPERAGVLDAHNAAYVLRTLALATDACLDGRAQALVTAPVQKSVINDAGIPFSGHTEFLAERTGAAMPVMMLATDTATRPLRVALATTHLPLQAVPAAITRQTLTQVLRILDADLRSKFAIANPRIVVCGLNPHAGEGGHLGREEIDVIGPVLDALRTEGLDLRGPLPADTLFTPGVLQDADAVLAMYHDQGLPVLKYAGFGNAVNVTLGLPILRTSVDHGTALDRAGRGGADAGSLRAALQLAIDLARQRAAVTPDIP